MNTITDEDELSDELADIRERGLAFSDGDITMGLRCVGAPVLSSDGNVLGAIAVCGLRSRISGDRFREVLPRLVRDTANIIEVNIQFSAEGYLDEEGR